MTLFFINKKLAVFESPDRVYLVWRHLNGRVLELSKGDYPTSRLAYTAMLQATV